MRNFKLTITIMIAAMVSSIYSAVLVSFISKTLDKLTGIFLVVGISLIAYFFIKIFNLGE